MKRPNTPPSNNSEDQSDSEISPPPPTTTTTTTTTTATTTTTTTDDETFVLNQKLLALNTINLELFHYLQPYIKTSTTASSSPPVMWVEVLESITIDSDERMLYFGYYIGTLNLPDFSTLFSKVSNPFNDPLSPSLPSATSALDPRYYRDLQPTLNKYNELIRKKKRLPMLHQWKEVLETVHTELGSKKAAIMEVNEKLQTVVSIVGLDGLDEKTHFRQPPRWVRLTKRFINKNGSPFRELSLKSEVDLTKDGSFEALQRVMEFVHSYWYLEFLPMPVVLDASSVVGDLRVVNGQQVVKDGTDGGCVWGRWSFEKGTHSWKVKITQRVGTSQQIPLLMIGVKSSPDAMSKVSFDDQGCYGVAVSNTKSNYECMGGMGRRRNEGKFIVEIGDVMVVTLNADKRVLEVKHQNWVSTIALEYGTQWYPHFYVLLGLFRIIP